MIEITAELTCDIATAWACWTLPEHVTEWNFAGDDWCCPWCENELRVGGRICSRMEARDGSMGFDFGSTYDVVEPNARLRLTMDDGSRWEVLFTSAASGCQVTQRFEPEQQNDPGLQRQGWQMILDRFASYASQRAA